MGFAYSRRYRVDVLSVRVPPWQAPTWLRLASAFDPLFSGVLGAAGVRTVQYEQGKLVRFGRLGWDAASHARWSVPVGAPRAFAGTEVWAPNRQECARQDRPPGAYLHLGEPDRLVLAVAVDAGPDALAAAEAALDVATGLLDAGQHRRLVRPWGRASPGGGFQSAIEDDVHSPNFAARWPAVP